MYLKKFIYVNWGNIPNCEFEFGPINLLSGGNGSGKTTAADAVQTIMTAAHENLYHFNPGQDESSQRGRGGKQVRTLPSYILGCDDGAYARPYACNGYLAAYFKPSSGEQADPFTALMGMSASLETSGAQKIARLDDIQFYILPNTQLALNDLVKNDYENHRIANLDTIFADLRRQFGKASVEKYEKKKDYLARLYGALRGKKTDAVNQREAINAARAFSRFMAYKPIKGIDEFVAMEVLEPRDLGEAIRNVSAMLKRIHTMDADAKKLREAIARMEHGRDTADGFISAWVEQQVLLYSLAKRRYQDCQKKYLNEKQRQQLLREAVAATDQKIQVCEQRREDLTKQIIDVNTRRMGIPALRDKDQLLADKREQEKLIHTTVPNLLLQAQQLEQNFHAAQQLLSALRKTSISLDLSLFADKFLEKICARVVDEHESIKFTDLLNRDWVDISPLEKKLDKALDLQRLHQQMVSAWFDTPIENVESLRNQLAQECSKRVQVNERLQKNIAAKKIEIQALDINQVIYPTFVRAALEALQQHCPSADARVLCDYVDIGDRAWQSAIEGYIGAARFGIIVNENYEADAIRLVRNLQSSGKNARVIQGEKARRDMEKFHLPAQSIVHFMRFTHATAEAYLKASYGSVERVEDEKVLRQTRRGLTQDAIGSSSYAMFRCDIPDSELVFGRHARERAREEKQRELEVFTREWQAASDYANEAVQLLRAIDKFKPLQLTEYLQQMLDAQRKVETLDHKLQLLDLSDSHSLDAELAALIDTEKTLKQEFSRLNTDRVNDAADLKNVNELCEELNASQEKTQNSAELSENNVSAISALWPEFNSELRLTQADIEATHQDVQYFEAHVKSVSTEIKKYLYSLQQAVGQHNLYCHTADGLLLDINLADESSTENFSAICDLRRHFDRLYNRDKNHILAQRQQEIESLRLSFNNAFVTNLCHSIYQAINDGKKILEDLNAELEHHRFGADRERFRFDYDWVPEFKEYWQFFNAVIHNPSIGEGETLFDTQLEPKFQKVRERLMAMLLDEDEQKALRDLSRIADYRNYRRYEIYKEPEGKAPIALSQYGTGSGGQLETPAYIIRSAAITSAFRFNEGQSHLRMVLVDEAFSKMDEHRSREVINYLTESLGLQLIFIMPSSKSGPFMDLISNQFVFSKCPTTEPVGELKSRVVLDRQVCNVEKIQALMAQHRSTVSYQASLDFMVDVE